MAVATTLADVENLKKALAGTSFTIATPESVGGAAALARALRIIDDHVLPRLTAIDAPLLAVVGGSTGSGKSTLVNTLVGENLSASSVVRPTTRHPVLVHRPEDSAWFMETTILPSLARVVRHGYPSPHMPGEPAHMELRSSMEIPPHLALLDAPDVDSVVEENRELARQMLDAADVWVFVTTAARYADAVPWSVLAPAVRRGVLAAIVLNRVPEGHTEVLRADLQRLMDAQGVGHVPLFTIEEHPLTDEMLDRADIGEIDGWLREHASSRETRMRVAHQAVAASLVQVEDSCRQVIAAIDAQDAAISDAHDTIGDATERAHTRLRTATADGSLLRGEVLSRWQDVVGAADLTRSLHRTVSFLRDRVTAAITGRPAAVQPVEDALEAGLVSLIEEELLTLRDEVHTAWRESAALRPLVARSTGHVDVHEVAVRAATEWQGDVVALIRQIGASKRQGARLMAVGVNVIAAALMIVIFASTGGLTGLEVGVAGASTALSHKLLEAVFGDQAVRKMTQSAQRMLADRLDEAAAAVMSPLRDVVAGVTPAQGEGMTVREAATQVLRVHFDATAGQGQCRDGIASEVER